LDAERSRAASWKYRPGAIGCPAEPGLIADLDQGHYYTVRDHLMH